MFTTIFGPGPDVKVLDFLAEHPEFDYTIMELSRHSDVARPTVYKVVDRLARKGIVSESRKIGNSTFYRLNLERPAVQRMLALRDGMATDAIAAPRKGKVAAGRRAQGRA